MSDPITDIENKKGQIDIGIMGGRVFKGAFEETRNRYEAFLVTFAFYAGMFKANPPNEKTDA